MAKKMILDPADEARKPKWNADLKPKYDRVRTFKPCKGITVHEVNIINKHYNDFMLTDGPADGQFEMVRVGWMWEEHKQDRLGVVKLVVELHLEDRWADVDGSEEEGTGDER